MTSAYRLHRSLLARVLGTNEGAVLGPFGPVAVVVAMNTASEGAAWEALVWLAAALPLTWLLVRNGMGFTWSDPVFGVSPQVSESPSSELRHLRDPARTLEDRWISPRGSWAG